MSNRLLIIWAYIKEAILASAIVGLIFLLFDQEDVIGVINSASGDIAKYFGVVMLAASLGLFWTFFSKSDSDFIRWLHEKKSFSVYAIAFMFSVGVYMALTASLLLTKHIDSAWLSIAALWLTVIGVINVFTLIKNAYDMMKLNSAFNSMKKKQTRSK